MLTGAKEFGREGYSGSLWGHWPRYQMWGTKHRPPRIQHWFCFTTCRCLCAVNFVHLQGRGLIVFVCLNPIPSMPGWARSSYYHLCQLLSCQEGTQTFDQITRLPNQVALVRDQTGVKWIEMTHHLLVNQTWKLIRTALWKRGNIYLTSLALGFVCFNRTFFNTMQWSLFNGVSTFRCI